MNLPLSAYIEFTLRTCACGLLSPMQKHNLAGRREISENIPVESLCRGEAKHTPTNVDCRKETRTFPNAPKHAYWMAAGNRLCVDSETLEHLPETLQGSFAVKIVC